MGRKTRLSNMLDGLLFELGVSHLNKKVDEFRDRLLKLEAEAQLANYIRQLKPNMGLYRTPDYWCILNNVENAEAYCSFRSPESPVAPLIAKARYERRKEKEDDSGWLDLKFT